MGSIFKIARNHRTEPRGDIQEVLQRRAKLMMNAWTLNGLVMILILARKPNQRRIEIKHVLCSLPHR